MDLILTELLNGKSYAIGDAVIEMQTEFQSVVPYTTVETLNGLFFVWDELFINKCLVALSTDSMEDMTETEREVFRAFIQFEDAMSHTADDEVVQDAIGCTIPDANGVSYIVTSTGTTIELCSNPELTVAKENISKALDTVLMKIYNCEDYNDVGIIEGDVTDIVPCTI